MTGDVLDSFRDVTEFCTADIAAISMTWFCSLLYLIFCVHLIVLMNDDPAIKFFLVMIEVANGRVVFIPCTHDHEHTLFLVSFVT